MLLYNGIISNKLQFFEAYKMNGLMIGIINYSVHHFGHLRGGALKTFTYVCGFQNYVWCKS